MALHFNKSSSSSSMVAGKSNYSPRNSESGNSIRRSFTGNPFKQPSINSPSDYPRRSSMSKESLISSSSRDYEKENGEHQNLKAFRIRSPAVKSTKHFMSPTISAASKIAAASPKKKVLGDWNESVRTSLLFSDLKNSETGPISAIVAPATTPKASKTVRFSDVELISNLEKDSESENVVAEEYDCVNLDPSFKISPISAIVAPATTPKASETVGFADVEVISHSEENSETEPENVVEVNLDPSFKISPVSSPIDAPYDPVTNYLAPRPQFLYYRPNLGSFSDETESEDSQKELDEASSSETEKEEEEFSSIEKEEEDVEELLIEEEKIEEKTSSKPQKSKRKIGVLVSLVFIACFSVFVNFYDPNLLERSRLLIIEDPSQIYEFAETRYNGLVRKFSVWPSISEFMFNTRAAPLNYFNLTDLSSNGGQGFVFDGWEKESNLIAEAEFETVEREEKEVHIEERENGFETVERDDEKEEGEVHIELESVEFETVERESQMNSMEDEKEVEVEVEEREKLIESVEREVEFEIVESQMNSMEDEKEVEVEVEEEREKLIESVEKEVQFETVEIENQHEETAATDESAHFETKAEFSYPSPEASNLEVIEQGEQIQSRIFPQNLALISGFFLLIPLLITTFVYSRKQAAKKELSPPLLRAEEFSCSSEMSSFQCRTKGEAEAHSHGKKTVRRNSKRESMASSSMEEFSFSHSQSPSYGSFTTYERIPTKNNESGEKDPTIITPVRRSSRIRMQISSP